MSSSSLSTLPVELVHYLFEYLDITTILFSFRYVCKRFHTIVNSFDQYKLDMRMISKYNFDRLCQIISPEKIHSIILTNDMNTPYQIRIFLSRFSFDQFSRLQSLTLIKIEENNLFSILMHISKCSLQSLTINCSSWDTFSYTIRVLLSSTIAKSNLEKLDLNISYRDLDMISWPPLPITLKYLRLERCTFQEYCMILRHAINLQKFELTECLMYNSDETIYRPIDIIYPLKLISLSFGACFMRMKELLIFLSCTPKLQYLKLIIWTDLSDSVIDGKKWENFISDKLPLLTRFEFFFDDLTHINQNSVNILSYTQPFRTPFWKENKHWYVMCDYVKTLSVIRLYSLPICNLLYTYYADSRKISDSTWKTTDNQMRLIHHIRELNLNLNEIVEPDNDIQVMMKLYLNLNILSLF